MLSGFLRVSAIAAVTLLANGAFAQPPEEITIPKDATIRLRIGETRIFKFGGAVKQIGNPEENIVEIRPESDRTFAFKGLAPGGTIVTARSDDSREVHRVRVVVRW
jgi:hypothetical protein